MPKLWSSLSLQGKAMVGVSTIIVGIIGWISFEEWSGRAFHSNKSEQKIGFFGAVTSSLDWCEDNYAETYWIAEFYNTLSSLFICGTAIVCFWIHKKKFQHVSLAFKFFYLNLFCVGLGSVLFHATLKWWMQIMDELPMIFSSLSYMYIMITKNRPGSALMLSLHWDAAILATWVEIWFPTHPELLQLMFLSNLLGDIYLGFYLVSEGNYELKANAERGLGICALAAVVWMSEPLICQNYGWLHLHSWWHFLSSLGCFFLVMLLQDAYGESAKEKEYNKQV